MADDQTHHYDRVNNRVSKPISIDLVCQLIFVCQFILERSFAGFIIGCGLCLFGKCIAGAFDSGYFHTTDVHQHGRYTRKSGHGFEDVRVWP
jgi:hypothetical protein